MKVPPVSIQLLWCPTCGRTDRFEQLQRQHFERGVQCPGIPKRLFYTFLPARQLRETQ